MTAIPNSSATSVTPSRKLRGFLAVLASLGTIFILMLLVLGLWPVPDDPQGDEATAGMSDGAAGLRQPFPVMPAPDGNLPTDEKNSERVALGYLLFFDPILSGQNDVSCATCHHPDLGFSDGRSVSMGTGGHGLGPSRAGGAALRRSSPSLWNVGYYKRQFWDGRANDLEEQALSPIKNPTEMNEDPEHLLAELKQIPEYVERFDRAFNVAKGSTISLENIGKALAAFERTLTANNSPFDRYVAGDRSALSDAQVRGFNVFRSGKTRCIECHGLPTFADQDFKAIGLFDDGKEPDLGRFEITGQVSDRSAFKIPTLRNVALTAPYMHNGSLKTLEDVIDFYFSGGRPRIGTPVDDKLRSFIITDEERRDLIAFLYALTDESRLPAFPERVPSGLPVISHLDTPARHEVQRYNVGSTKPKSGIPGPQLRQVTPGQSIQEAINAANPGDTIEVAPGVYHEQIFVDQDDLTIRGAPLPGNSEQANSVSVAADGSRRPLLDGGRKWADGVIVSGRHFRMEGFDIRGFTANGVFAQYARDLMLAGLRIDKTGRNGVHLMNSSGALIEGIISQGLIDSGVYLNSSRDTHINNCVIYGNAIGVNVENCLRTTIEANQIHDNAVGVLLSALPKNVSKVAKDARILGNYIIDNNARNQSELGTLIGGLPRGVGLLILSADNTEVAGNEFRGNASYAVGVFGAYSFGGSTSLKISIESIPENNYIHDNQYANNGHSPDTSVPKLGFLGGDLVWDMSGWSNKWLERTASPVTPILDARWPAFARRIRWRLLHLL